VEFLLDNSPFIDCFSVKKNFSHTRMFFVIHPSPEMVPAIWVCLSHTHTCENIGAVFIFKEYNDLRIFMTTKVVISFVWWLFVESPTCRCISKMCIDFCIFNLNSEFLLQILW